jgi:hypothetical protein
MRKATRGWVLYGERKEISDANGQCIIDKSVTSHFDYNAPSALIRKSHRSVPGCASVLRLLNDRPGVDSGDPSTCKKCFSTFLKEGASQAFRGAKLRRACSDSHVRFSNTSMTREETRAVAVMLSNLLFGGEIDADVHRSCRWSCVTLVAKST